MRPFYLIRHGETDWNIKYRRLQGHTDIPLNEIGKSQALEIAPIVAKLNVTRLISSDLSRAFETAQLINQNGLPLLIDRNLREVKLGEAEGKTPDEIDLKLGHEFRKNWSSPLEQYKDLKFSNGESRRDVINRISPAITQYLEQYPNDLIAFVSHGFAIRSLIYESTQVHGDFFVKNCTIVPFELNKDRKIHYAGPKDPHELASLFTKS